MNYKLLYDLEREDNTRLKTETQLLKQQVELLQLRIDILKTKVELVGLPTHTPSTLVLSNTTYFALKA